MKASRYNIGQGAEPAFFIQGPSPFARFVFFSVLSLALIVTDSRLQYLTFVRSKLEAYLHPLTLMVNAPSELYHHIDNYLTSHHTLLAENKKLKNFVIKANVDAQALKSLSVENNNLRHLFHLKNRIVQDSQLAEILHASSDQFSKKIVVNRGKSHSVNVGASVVDAKGIVGQVTRVYPQTSSVTLLTDKSMEIPVMVERNGLRAIAFGHGRSNQLEIPYLPANVDIKEGDKLTTSGIDGVYPSGIAVAVVNKISIAPGSTFVRILCTPVGDVEYHRQVLVVNPILIDVPQEEALTLDENVEGTVKEITKGKQNVSR